MTLFLTPDLGQLDQAALFDAAQNTLLLAVDLSTLPITTEPEGDPHVKGVFDFRLTIGGAVFEIPLTLSRRLAGRNGGVVRWKTSGGASGVFRFFREAPPVFENEELVR